MHRCHRLHLFVFLSSFLHLIHWLGLTRHTLQSHLSRSIPTLTLSPPLALLSFDLACPLSKLHHPPRNHLILSTLCCSTLATKGIGASYGTSKSGVGIAAMGVLRPDLMMKCIVPVVMAGIIAVSPFPCITSPSPTAHSPNTLLQTPKPYDD